MNISSIQAFLPARPMQKIQANLNSYKSVSFGQDTFEQQPTEFTLTNKAEMMQNAGSVFTVARKHQDKFFEFEAIAQKELKRAQESLSAVRCLIRHNNSGIHDYNGSLLVNKYLDEKENGRLVRRTYYNQLSNSSNNFHVNRIEEYNKDGSLTIIELLPESLSSNDKVVSIAKGLRFQGPEVKIHRPAKNFNYILSPNRNQADVPYTAIQEFYYDVDVIGKEFVEKNPNGTYKAQVEYENVNPRKKVMNVKVEIPNEKDKLKTRIRHRYKFENYGQGNLTTAQNNLLFFKDGSSFLGKEYYFRENELEHYMSREKVSPDFKYSVHKEWTNTHNLLV